MLISLKLNNCFIYNNEVEFSMRANMHYKRFSSNVSKHRGINILKTAMIMGPNNSGKTNFIKAIRAIQSTLLNNKAKIQKNLFSESTLCEIELVFLHDQKEYVYEFKYDIKTHEYVYERFAHVEYDRYKNRKERIFIVRDAMQQKFESVDDDLAVAMKVTAKNNILIYLIDTTQFPVLQQIKTILTSFASKIDILDMNNIPLKNTIDMLKSSNESKNKVINFILNSDLCLDDYRYMSDDEVKFCVATTEEQSADVKPQENALNLSAPVVEMLHLCSVYKGVPVPSILFDSTGTKKIAAISSYVINALENGRILVVDELDNSLHFRLTRAIIALFNNELNENAQLICTVHDVSLLDCNKLFRKEQIWFAHKDRDNAYLYSLSEFTTEKHRVRDTTDLIEKYQSGVFGALPEPDLIESLLEVRG